MKSEKEFLTADVLLKIMDQMKEAVYIIDGDGTIRYVNKAAADVERQPIENMIGKQLTHIYETFQFHEGMDSPTLVALEKGEDFDDDNREWYALDGTAINALVTAHRIGLTKEEGAYCLADDIPTLKKRLCDAGSVSRKTTYRMRLNKLNNGTSYVFNDIVCSCEKMSKAINDAKLYAIRTTPVMICGETGTGKELFAQSIHNASSYVSGPFVPVNCAAIPDTLLESTLFGTKKGAFTGAIDSPGLFEQANGGTLFLDEINSMPISLQAKILRALQEKEVQRIGEAKRRPFHCRIISATNKNPEQAIIDKELRSDLFYRLSTGVIWVPPLRERGGDLELLIDYFIDRCNLEMGTTIEEVSTDFYDLLQKYTWPGNVRELGNTVESAVNLTESGESILKLTHLPSYLKHHFAQELANRPDAINIMSHPKKHKPEGLPSMDFSYNINTLMSEYEKGLIELALSSCRGNLTKCGEKLGISRQALTFKIRKLGLEAKNYKK